MHSVLFGMQKRTMGSRHAFPLWRIVEPRSTGCPTVVVNLFIYLSINSCLGRIETQGKSYGQASHFCYEP
jgi:hypothetical protein